MGVLREPSVLVVIFIGRPIPVDAHPQPGHREAAEQAQFAVITDVAFIAVLHGESSFKPAEAALAQSLLRTVCIADGRVTLLILYRLRTVCSSLF